MSEMIKTLVLLFFSVILQNASFTLVSRARNSKSIAFHAGASVLSNGIWFIVIQQLTKTPVDSLALGITYTVAAVIGSISMHYFSMHYIEKWFDKGFSFNRLWNSIKESPNRYEVIKACTVNDFVDFIDGDVPLSKALKLTSEYNESLAENYGDSARYFYYKVRIVSSWFGLKTYTYKDYMNVI